MHWYKKNIGDYHKKAGRLTMLQHGAYTLLIDACYDREKFPTLDEAIDWLWASTTEEIEAVKFVLTKFFTLEDGVYVQNRISEEIGRYHDNAANNKRIAVEREAKRKAKSTNRVPSVNEAPPNQEPVTNNHKPVTKNKEPSYSDDSLRVAVFLEEKIKSINKDAKTNPKSWAVDIDRAIRLDNRTVEGLIKVINWIYSPAGNFWKPNILSGSKLREKYDQLEIQSSTGNNQPVSKHNGFAERDYSKGSNAEEALKAWSDMK